MEIFSGSSAFLQCEPLLSTTKRSFSHPTTHRDTQPQDSTSEGRSRVPSEQINRKQLLQSCSGAVVALKAGSEVQSFNYNQLSVIFFR